MEMLHYPRLVREGLGQGAWGWDGDPRGTLQFIVLQIICFYLSDFDSIEVNSLLLTGSNTTSEFSVIERVFLFLVHAQLLSGRTSTKTDNDLC